MTGHGFSGLVSAIQLGDGGTAQVQFAHQEHDQISVSCSHAICLRER